MEFYREAYDNYCSACDNYGMESMNFIQFIKNLTIDQLKEFCKNTK
jgi:hypothetical protein